MSALEGKWKSCPELTEGMDEYLKATGAKHHQGNCPFTMDISQDNGTWKVVLKHPDNPERDATYNFQSGVEFDSRGPAGQYIAKGLVDVDGDRMKSRTKIIVNDEVKRQWESETYIDGQHLVFKQISNGVSMLNKLKRI